MRTVCFDVEVLRGPEDVVGGWENPEGMGFGTAVTWDTQSQMFRFFGPDQLDKLICLLTAADIVVGFNHIRFDYKVIYGNTYGEQECYERGKDVDLLIEIIRKKFPGCMWVEEAEEKHGPKNVHDGSCGLNGISRGTFGTQKSGHGAHAPKLIQEGRWAEVLEYNLHDVRLTWAIYNHWITRGFVIDGRGNVIRR